MTCDHSKRKGRKVRVSIDFGYLNLLLRPVEEESDY